MDIKADLIERVRQRLKLTIKCGFPSENAEYFIDELEKVPEQKFSNPVEMNYICNHIIPAFEAHQSGASDFDCMGPSKWKYYQSLQKSRHNLRKGEQKDYFNFIGVRNNCNSALDMRAVHAHEARIPLWEFHSKQQSPKGDFSTEHLLFFEHCELASRYRQVIFNPFWDQMNCSQWYKENTTPEQLTLLLDRILGWIAEQPQDYLKKACKDNSHSNRTVALAFQRFGEEEKAKQFFNKAFEQAKLQKKYSLQERLLLDMKEAGIPSSFKDRARISAMTKVGYL